MIKKEGFQWSEIKISENNTIFNLLSLNESMSFFYPQILTHTQTQHTHTHTQTPIHTHAFTHKQGTQFTQTTLININTHSRKEKLK